MRKQLQNLLSKGKLAFLDLKLKYKMVFVFSLVIIFSVLLVSFVSLRISEGALTDEVTKLMESDLSNSGERINSILKSWVDKSNYFFSSNTIIRLLSGDYTGEDNKVLDFYDEANTAFGSFNKYAGNKLIIKQSYIELYSFNDTLPKDEYYIKNSNEFLPFKLNKSTISKYQDPFWLPVSRTKDGNLVITYCIKVYSLKYAENVGLLNIHIPVRAFKDEIAKIQLPSGSWISYLGSDGKEILSVGSIKNKSAEMGSIKQKITAENNQTRYNFDRFIVLSCITPENGGKLLMLLPRSYFNEKVSNISKATLLVVFLAILLTAVFSYWLSKLITGRLTRFVDSVSHIVNEENPDLTLVQGNDEIGMLNNKFNHLVSRVNTLLRERFDANVKRKILELEMLQYQVNPHYIYNILSEIRVIGDRLQSSIISEITDSTVKFFKLSLNKGCEIISIAQELEMVREYINIQLLIYDERFNVEYDIDPEILNWYTIKLILQPIVENAIIHGINGNLDFSGKIKIIGRQELEDVVFTVEDNGMGMDESELIQFDTTNIARNPRKGYGIRNVNERLRLLFAPPYGLFIESKINIGTRVTIRIPKHDEESLQNEMRRIR